MHLYLLGIKLYIYVVCGFWMSVDTGFWLTLTPTLTLILANIPYPPHPETDKIRLQVDSESTQIPYGLIARKIKVWEIFNKIEIFVTIKLKCNKILILVKKFSEQQSTHIQSELYIVTPYIVTSYKIPLYIRKNQPKDYANKPLYNHNL